MNSSAAKKSTQRALAAIVLTDAAGFSARMSDDEEGTLALIQRDLKLMADLCDRYGGQVLKSTGDGLLMSFVSGVQAVSCGQEIQKQLAALAEGLPFQEYLQHRIGIHLGDVLFSHTDVLGNGVNIAARLQTQSTPGGICISQTVYDVVKARLRFNATFLGSLKLKNIKEPVPAFQIPPFGQPATMVVQAQPQVAKQEANPLVKIAQALQQDAQNRRLKKLIFSTCQGVWENDAAVLSQFDFLPLLEKICHRHRTLASLEEAFQAMASQLNRKAEYLSIADTILEALEPIYLEKVASSATSEEDKTTVTDKQAIYQAIATDFTQQRERLRIKKLLYAVIHTTWENDPIVLAQQPMEALVVAVHQIALTKADLSYHLDRIIRRLNRRSRYTQVAVIISDAFKQLYEATSYTSLTQIEATALALASGEQTEMAAKDVSFGTNDEGLTSVTRLDSIGHRFSNEQTIAHPKPAPQVDTQKPHPAKSRDRANLFNLRLEIMRYSNPLRAKILLLSTVRSPFAFSQQDWSTLKAKTLDDLIQDAFQYCKTYADLESKLTIMCHCVDNVSENMQAAGAILQAMKPFYPLTNSSRRPA